MIYFSKGKPDTGSFSELYRKAKSQRQVNHMSIQNTIADLVGYGLATGLIRDEDSIYTANRLLELLHFAENREKDEVRDV